ncbi:xylose ABC transporter ATP-binding protein [Sansalvadorimonas sp. 2012CJ34-2]|uniref:Xylose ABC transporter ATP-binding protein n=1 Tax=Parendozoicomonas callyspongiae TaxID=2942213 RepID=A0ABT0PKJ2_9GAMM|nr:xylose ABC transporter ATP-binding protein [Sansalvadorimonas sp. 2012CJ34-2]MCL6271894.1 xylose ABC transporter ATP-binding protein [Sansalvadorimonas sp. 2012CJ34-2]
MSYLLEMQGISKDFSGIKALDNVFFNVKPAEVVSLCGENGSGKSTLMKVLTGVHPAGSYAGEITFNGKSLSAQSIKDSEAVGIAIIHQELALVKELSIMENIFLGSEIHSYGRINFNAMLQKTRELLKQVFLDVPPTTLVKHLGVGQQQLVEIAKALSKNASLLILDEPSSSLTESETKILLNIVCSLRERGVSCVYISHKLDEIMAISDRVCVIRDGLHIATKEIAELNQDRIIQMMVGREMANLFPREDHPIGDVVLEVRNCTAHDPWVQDIKRVDDVSFTVREGEILGISGLVGAGRTELMQCLFGCYPGSYDIEILLDNKPIKVRNSAEALRQRVAMVPEDRKRHGIIPGMSVAKNLSLANLLNYQQKMDCIDSSHEVADVLEYIKKLRVKTASPDLQIKSLSGGNQQKVVLAKNLLIGPKVLILDEPTRGVDVGAKYEIYKVMFELIREGISIIMVSSELPEVLGISDRVLVMHEGKLKGNFVNQDLTQEMIMESALGSCSDA